MSKLLLKVLPNYRLKQESEAMEIESPRLCILTGIVSIQIFVITPLNIELAISFCQQGADLS